MVTGERVYGKYKRKYGCRIKVRRLNWPYESLVLTYFFLDYDSGNIKIPWEYTLVKTLEYDLDHNLICVSNSMSALRSINACYPSGKKAFI